MVSGGAGRGQGRRARVAPKAKSIWCGQITDEQRDFIMQWLSPDERFSVLMAEANKACTRRGGFSPATGIIHPEADTPAQGDLS